MRSNHFFKYFLAFFLVLLLSAAQAQVAGKRVVKSYKKVSSDTCASTRVAVNDSIPVKSVGGGVSSARKDVSKPKKSKIDSLSYSAKVYTLGERLIMPGDSGRDVRSVAKILVNKIYIDESELKYTSDGGVVYEGRLVEALNHFQEFNGLRPDGIIGQAVIKALRKRK